MKWEFFARFAHSFLGQRNQYRVFTKEIVEDFVTTVLITPVTCILGHTLRKQKPNLGPVKSNTHIVRKTNGSQRHLVLQLCIS